MHQFNKLLFRKKWLEIRLVIGGFRTDFDDFMQENVGEQAGHIKRTQEDIRIDVKISHGLSKRKRN